MRPKIGTWLVILAYVLLLLNALSTLFYVRQGGGAHEHHDYISPWALSLLAAVTLLGIRVCLHALRKGERWAWMATVMTWLVIAVPRLVNDPRCLQLDLSRHGCHTFMITLAVAVVGLVLSRPPRGA